MSDDRDYYADVAEPAYQWLDQPRLHRSQDDVLIEAWRAGDEIPAGWTADAEHGIRWRIVTRSHAGDDDRWAEEHAEIRALRRALNAIGSELQGYLISLASTRTVPTKTRVERIETALKLLNSTKGE